MNRRRMLGALGVTSLALGAAPLLSSCTSKSADNPASPSPTSSAPIFDARAATVVVESELLVATLNVLARFPATAQTLEPVRDAHRAHLTALGASEPTEEPTAGPSRRLPATGNAAVRQLARLERDAATDHAAAALRTDTRTARLVASLAAYSAAQHVALDRSTR